MDTDQPEPPISFDVRPRWHTELGKGPIVGAAIHSGHDLRAELVPLLAISESERFREEDPYADYWATACPTRLLADRSRFEVDLNRPRNQAVYRDPEDAWGLNVWKHPLSEATVARSLAGYDSFYEKLVHDLAEIEHDHRRFIVLDLHTYNHRRTGPDGPEADPDTNPDINIGTGTMPDRDRWAPVIERFIADLRDVDCAGKKLDVRENINFKGGWFPNFIHARFPDTACVLSVEVKKFFMDEWTGEANRTMVADLHRIFRYAAAGLYQEWTRL